jgi:hypothetical protein
VVSYPPRAAKALGFLKSSVNDVEVFVEDTGNLNMWSRIIRRLLPANVRFSSVTPFGGRDKVLAACKLDQANDGRRKIYIIDGDFDAPRRMRKPRYKFLYRLRAYCIENLLLDEAAFVAVGLESSHRSTEADVRTQLDWSGLSAEIDRLLKPLFELYAATMHVAPSVGTVSFSVYKCAIKRPCGSYIPDSSAVRLRGRSVIRQALNVCSKQALRASLRMIHINSRLIPASKMVSGKDYLFPLYFQVLNRRLGYRGSDEQLKVRLAGEFNPKMEPAFARAIAAL